MEKNMGNEDQGKQLTSRMGHDAESLAWGFAGHLKYSLGLDRYSASGHDRFMALAYAIRDRLVNQWIQTQQTHHKTKAKRVYYLSLEFLMGRSMGNNAYNLGVAADMEKALSDLGYRFEEIREEEVDAGLGNGGLGRLAACFLDSLATLDIPAFGYGLRYDYGIFRQEIENGWQVEHPDDWTHGGCPWEIERSDTTVDVNFGGRVETLTENGKQASHWIDTHVVQGVAYDMPIVGYGGKTVNTLRLWSARAPREFNFAEFNTGDYVDAVSDKVNAENLTKVLYPNDTLYLGKELRLKQQYFFVACSLADIIRRFKKTGAFWKDFPNHVAIQLNDTHPSMAIPELLRILIDVERLDWKTAWEITVATFGYTNHTLMPEALEKWPVPMLEKLFPRHLQIIYEINKYFLQDAIIRFHGDQNKVRAVSLIEESNPKHIRMANLCIVASHSTNGVAALHTELLKSHLVPELAALFPQRFNNKTNGITQRRWLLKANPGLASLITQTIGGGWITHMDELKKLIPYAQDAAFQEKFRAVKREAKIRLVKQFNTEFGWQINPDSIFDIQVKRMHEYKRQLLNALHIVMLYNDIKKNGTRDFVPRTFLIGGKAAPGYTMAKLIIKFIGNLSSVINNDPDINDVLKVFFLPNYRVSLAERLFPAADISEQISTAGTEASGTGNMKFMCNGALTVGTLDGANIEIAEEVGEDNIFIFGLKTPEAAELRGNYNAASFAEADPAIREALDLISSGAFNYSEPGIFDPLCDMLFNHDRYLHLADLASYAQAQKKVSCLYKDPVGWTKKAILNVAMSGKFSSDRTIREYAAEIWKVKPVPIKVDQNATDTLDNARNPKQ
ncbi:MAG: glycogen/starch/alpha-glucan phosphorylase [Spirochaetales bacterium]|jgi:starch phosphorylase|nr:glycogen/starch/alpha-glucan phosphorylase [Spirochaetales bacterium]